MRKIICYYKSGQQTFTPVPLPLVFVGYGIVAPEYDYNDYQSVDVEGKIVVFIDGEPVSDDPDFLMEKYQLFTIILLEAADCIIKRCRWKHSDS